MAHVIRALRWLVWLVIGPLVRAEVHRIIGHSPELPPVNAALDELAHRTVALGRRVEDLERRYPAIHPRPRGL